MTESNTLMVALLADILCCFFLETEEAQGDDETDQAISQQAQDIGEDTHEIFAKDHHPI